MGDTTNGTTQAASTALVPVPLNATTALEPHSSDEAFTLAKRLVASELLPKSIKKPEAAFAIIIAGRELGLTAMQSLRSIHIIEGKPSLSADLMAALAKRSPKCVYFQLVESSGTVATYETQRVGEPKPTRMSFTLDEAKAAGVTGKDNWKKYPAAMLRARCIAALVRVVYPDLTMGIYEEDELTPPPSQPRTVDAVVIDTSPAAPAPTVDDDAVAHWSQRMSDAGSIEELEATAAECKETIHDTDTLIAIGRAYVAAKAVLTKKDA